MALAYVTMSKPLLLSLSCVILQAMLAGAAFLQGFFDFCAGCVIFEYLLKWGLISKSVYRMHINTRWVAVHER